MNPHNLFAKHVNLQLAQTPVFDDRCYQYTQSMSMVQSNCDGVYYQFCGSSAQGVEVQLRIILVQKWTAGILGLSPADALDEFPKGNIGWLLAENGLVNPEFGLATLGKLVYLLA